MKYLLDTCVLSEYIKKQPTQQVIAWLDAQDEANLFISSISMGEINKGIVKLQKRQAERAEKLGIWLNTLEQRFSTRILSLDNQVMRVWGEMYARAEQRGQPLPLMDSLLMATAAHYALIIVTRNVDDFAGYPHVFNP